jgi:ribosome-associated protein
LRALIRQARKDAKPEVPGEALRHGRAYRDIFQIARAQLLDDSSATKASEPGSNGDQEDAP